MPKPGKPVLNPFTAVSPSGKKQAVDSSASTTGTDRPERPIFEQTRGIRRGISIVATENRLTQLPMRKATLVSTALHVVGPFVCGALVLLVLLILSWIMHFNFWDVFKPKAPPHDMEFTLVSDTQATRPDKPVFKGNFNQRAGGKQNKAQPLKALEEPPHASAASKPKAVPTKTQTPQPQAQPTPQEQASQPKPEPPQAAKPDSKPAIPKPAKTETPKPSQTHQATHNNAAASQPAESPQIASVGTSMAGVGTLDNPSTGNPQNGDSPDPGVDVAQDVDFGPFMADLERRIKRNWTPPRGAESRKVLLVFFLARDGQVVKIETKKSSGDEEADRAAIAAVQASAPFQAFPPQVKEDILPVEFTFDYNVLNPKNPKQALKW